MMTDVAEALPRTDNREIMQKMEERARKEGEARGKAEGMAEGRTQGMAEGMAQGKAEGKVQVKTEIAVKAFSMVSQGRSPAEIADMLNDLGISSDIVQSARKQTNADQIWKMRGRSRQGQ